MRVANGFPPSKNKEGGEIGLIFSTRYFEWREVFLFLECQVLGAVEGTFDSIRMPKIMSAVIIITFVRLAIDPARPPTHALAH